jgi:hypothetical protein
MQLKMNLDVACSHRQIIFRESWLNTHEVSSEGRGKERRMVRRGGYACVPLYRIVTEPKVLAHGLFTLLLSERQTLWTRYLIT